MNATKLWNRNYVLLLLTMLCMTTALTMSSAAITPYVVSRNFDLEIASLVAGIMTLASMIARPFSGLLGDNYPKKNVVFLATVSSGIFAFLMSLQIPISLLGIMRVCFGISFSIATTVTMAMIGDYVPVNRIGSALGFYGVGLGVAQATGPALAFWIAEHISYSAVYVFAAFAIAVSAIAINLLPLILCEKKMEMCLSIQNMFAKEVLYLIPACFCIGALLGVENSFLALFAEEKGIHNVGWYFTLYGMTMIGVRLLSGNVFDRLPFPGVFYSGIAMIAVTFLLFSLADIQSFSFVLTIAAIVRAIGIGFFQPALQNACMNSVSPDRRTVASGMYYLGSDLGMGITPVIGAKIYCFVGNSYPKMFRLLILITFFAAAVFCIYKKNLLKRPG